MECSLYHSAIYTCLIAPYKVTERDCADIRYMIASPVFLLSVKIYLNLLFHNDSDDLRNYCLLLFFSHEQFFFYADNMSMLRSFPLSEVKNTFKRLFI